MSHVLIRYQRSVDVHNLAYKYLKRAAAQGQDVTYKQLAWIVGLPLCGNYMSRELGESLRGTFQSNAHPRLANA